MSGGWELSVLIEDLRTTQRILVRSDSHIGGVMLNLVEATEARLDWSDHRLWWPEQNRWLLKTRSTLDQSGVEADAKLEFRRMHGDVWLQLPDLQERRIRVSFAQSVFGVVVGACRELGIRHPEELSLRRAPSRPSDNGTLGGRFGSFRRSKTAKGSQHRLDPAAGTNGSSGQSTLLPSRQTSLGSSKSPQSDGPLTSPVSLNSLVFEGAELAYLANSPSVSAQTAFGEKGLIRPKSLAERAALNESWLDSSQSLMEQGVRPDAGSWEDQGCLQLRYKFHTFYDLNVKYDSVRINQIYEQVKWSLLSEELECTEEEMLLLAALQLQIRLASSEAATAAAARSDSSVGRHLPLDEADAGEGKAADDDIDAALAELEASLLSDTCLTLGSPKQQQQQQQQQSPGVSKVPELMGLLKFFKPRKHTIRSYHRYYFVLRETQLTMYTDHSRARQLEAFSLLSSEVAPDVNAATRKFGIRLFVPNTQLNSPDGGRAQEIWLRCDSKDQFADWMSGLRLAARGRTLASRAEFEAEAKATVAQLELQAPRPQPRLTLDGSPDIDPADFLSPRHLKGRKSRWLLQRILERHANVRDRSPIEAKLDYINVCQRLATYGVAYFVVQCVNGQSSSLTFNEFRKTRTAKEELVGVAQNRLMLMELASGQIVNTWRFEELESWTVNWEVLSLQLLLNRPPHGIVLVPCPSCPAVSKQSLCKALAEFIGGNVFLSLRKPEQSQELNEQLFHQLTAYRDPKDYR